MLKHISIVPGHVFGDTYSNISVDNFFLIWTRTQLIPHGTFLRYFDNYSKIHSTIIFSILKVNILFIYYTVLYKLNSLNIKIIMIFWICF